MTCLDGIGWGAGEGDEIDGIGSVPSLPVQSRTRTKLAGSRGECEMGRGLVQPARVESHEVKLGSSVSLNIVHFWDETMNN